MCRLCVCGSVHVQPCVPERMNFYIRRRRKIIASERTERSNLVVSMGLELFFLWRALHIPYVSKYAQTKFPTHL